MKKKLDPFDQFICDVPVTTSVVQEKLYEAKVPNRHPSITNTPYRIAIIADEPSRDDILGGQPFLGAAGRSLSLRLSRAGILRDACFLGYSNDPDRLTHDLNVYSPHICLLLGRNTLGLAHGTHSLGDWRGSVFVSTHDGPFKGRKCIPSYHPADCNRNYDWTPLLFFDIKKCSGNFCARPFRTDLFISGDRQFFKIIARRERPRTCQGLAAPNRKMHAIRNTQRPR